MSWDGFQREVLAELGLRTYAVADRTAQDAQGLVPTEGARATPSGAMTPRLVAALARAAGCAPAQVVALAGIAAAPADVATRRALWPRLRRLRSQAR